MQAEVESTGVNELTAISVAAIGVITLVCLVTGFAEAIVGPDKPELGREPLREPLRESPRGDDCRL